MDLNSLPDDELDRLLAESKPQLEDLSDEQLDQLLSQSEKAPKESSLADQAQAGIESFGKGASFGLLPTLQAGAETAIEGVTQFIPGTPAYEDAKLREQGFDIQQPGETFSEKRLQNIERQQQQGEEFPITTVLGEIGGAVTGGLGAGGALRAGGAAAARSAGLSGVAKTFGQKALANIAEGAAIGALEGVGSADSISELPSAIADKALTGAEFGAIMPAIEGTAKVAKFLGKKAFPTIFGVAEETVDQALKNPAVFDIDNVGEAREALADKASKLVDEIKRKSVETTTSLADNIDIALGDLKTLVVNESHAAARILDIDNVKVPRSIIKDAINKAKSGLKIGDKTAFGGASKAAVKKLDDLAKTADLLPDNLTGPQAKRLLQQLDSDIDFVATPGSFSRNPIQQKMSEVRGAIDRVIKKQSDAYAQQMTKVSSLTHLLNETSKQFGGGEKAFRAAQQLSKNLEQGGPKARLFRQFAEQTGLDIDTVEKAQRAAKVVQNFNESNIPNKLKALGGRNSAMVKKQFDLLSQQSDEAFDAAVETLNLADNFNSTFLRGSRNVNLWAVMGAMGQGALGKGGLTGGAAGGFLGGPVGAAMGAAIGAYVDVFGPSIAKQILKGVSKIQGIPTVRKIMLMDLPPNVKNKLISDLNAVIVSSAIDSDQETVIPAEDRVTFRKEIRDSDLDEVTKTKMLNQLNKKGTIEGLNKLVGSSPKSAPQIFTQGRQSVRKPRTLRDAADAARKAKRQPEY